MDFLNIDLKKWVFIVSALLLPLITINMEQKPLESTWMSRPFFYISNLIQEGLYEFSSGVKSTTAEYLNLLKIKKNNSELTLKNSELNTRLLAFNEVEEENRRLKDLLNFKQNSKMDLISAQVVGRDLVPDHRTVTLNKGTQDGLKAGQAVLSMNGVVGYIFRPGEHLSHVLLITDRYAVVDAVLERTRMNGIVEGRGTRSLLVLKYVEGTEDVKSGDLVVTGGLDNIFPKGYPIAEVQSVEKRTMSISIELKPLIDPRSIEEVFVVANAAHEVIGNAKDQSEKTKIKSPKAE